MAALDPIVAWDAIAHGCRLTASMFPADDVAWLAQFRPDALRLMRESHEEALSAALTGDELAMVSALESMAAIHQRAYEVCRAGALAPMGGWA